MHLRSDRRAARRISQGFWYDLARPGTRMCHNHDMKFRTGLIIGLGVGYVLGSRAGRERYDQMKAVVDRLAANEQVKKVAAVAGQSTEGARNLAGTGLVAAGGAMREAAAKAPAGTDETATIAAEDTAPTRRWRTPRYRPQSRQPTAAR